MKVFPIILSIVFLLSALFSSCNEEILIDSEKEKQEERQEEKMMNQKNKIENKTELKTQTQNKQDDTDYKNYWVKIRKQRHKPKSALKLVEKLYKLAVKNKNEPQIIKALIFKMKYLQEVEENTLVKVHALMLNVIKESSSPQKEILHSMLAEIYWTYYQQNRYRFLSRTKGADVDDLNMKTWTLNKIVHETQKHYALSLKNKSLLKTKSIEDYQDILQEQMKTRALRPTLYDFLIYRAIRFYSDSESGLTKPSYYFQMNHEYYFGDTEAFIALDIQTKDVGNFKYLAVKLYQEWLKSHIADDKPYVLIDIELNRLQFVYQHASFSNKEVLYELALDKLQKAYKETGGEILSEIYYKMAYLKYKLSQKYNPEHNRKYKNHKKEALELCESKVLQASSKTEYAKEHCLDLKTGILNKSIHLVLEKSHPIKKNFKGLLTYKNVTKLYAKVVKTSFKEYQTTREAGKNILDVYNEKKEIASFTFTLPNEKDFNTYKLELPFKGLASGKYLLLLSNSPSFEDDEKQEKITTYNLFNITNIAYIKKDNRTKGVQFYFKNYETGEVLKNVNVTLYRNVWSRLKRRYVIEKDETITADSKGYLIIHPEKRNNSYYLQFKHKGDEYFPEESFYFYHYQPRNYTQNRTFYFMDRKIYRPGQTVYFKALNLLLNDKKVDKAKLLKDKAMTFTLYDANYQKVSSLKLTSNAFGTTHGSFQLPKNTLTEQYSIDNGNNRVYFSVEEYKRPKFEVSFKKLTKEYQLRDLVELEGEAKAFAGFKIDGAKVKYRIVRETYYPYSWYFYGYIPSYPKVEIKHGVTKTDEKGSFKVKFEAIPDLDQDVSKKPASRFTVYADVTDVNGETRTASKSITIGYTSLILSIQAKEKIDLSQKEDAFHVDSKNLSQEFLPTKGEVMIYRLASPSTFYLQRLWEKANQFLMSEARFKEQFPHDLYKNEGDVKVWKKEELVFKAPFDTKVNKRIALKHINKWKQGKYLIEAHAKDSLGNAIKAVKYVTVYDSNAKELPYPMMFWTTKLNEYESINKPVSFLLGSSDQIQVKYELVHNGVIVDSKNIPINKEQKKINISLKESYRGGLYVNLAFIKKGRVYTVSEFITIPWDNKELNISYETFRDKLLPGAKEEWCIKVSGKNKDKLVAEMLATMYDASLDTFRANYWSFPLYSYYYHNIPFSGRNELSYSSHHSSRHYYINQSTKRYDALNWFGFRFYERRRYYKKSMERYDTVTLNAPKAEASAIKEEASEGGKFQFEADKVSEKKEIGKRKPQPSKDRSKKEEVDQRKAEEKVQIRKNFQETAFFYPNLTTNEAGDIYIRFTMPDALTKWKFLAFAHTKNLEFALTSKEIITQKDLMVNSNAPRFLREGDSLTFTTKITSLADKTLKGTAKLLLFDAISMKPVNDRFKHKNLEKPFAVKSEQSVKLSWKLQIPEGISAVTYRVVAKANDFSDGEEMALPILSNRMLVTESMPLPLRSKETKSFEFKKLINNKSTSLKNHKLTLEFTSNPVWYAVQALPYLMEYPYECMEQTFSRYYANRLAQFIVQKSPKIKQVFEAWKRNKDSKALVSNLEKNEELKALLLKETPWVRDAYSETEQKHRIALLFDLNKMSNELYRALKKLEEGQMASGGWPWFKGGRENRWITQHIVTGFAHLYRLGAFSLKEPKIRNMLKEALAYLDREIKKDYDYLIKHKLDLKKQHISHTHIHYLYARSYFKNLLAVSSSHKVAFDYYENQAKTYWSQFNHYTKGMIALFLYRDNEKKLANEIMDSIQEHFISSEEMGLYFKSSYGYNWYNAPIETHALLIEAFDEIKRDQKTVDGLKTWLLKSKQTQNWKTTKATVDAIYALLLKGSDWLQESKLAEITIGGEKLDDAKDETLKVEEGTGYFKKSWSKESIKPEMGKVVITNRNNLVAWGALYWQYFEDLDKITFSETHLSLKKELFIEKNTDTGPSLVAIDKATVKVGDKLKVRIILKVDRDMEYVHMKDMRASNLEPLEVLSKYHYQDGLGYYQSIKDASVDFFFDRLNKGTYVFEYLLHITHEGDFSNGITTIQSMYAPEFTSHSKGRRVQVSK